jgi:hypothetical protein
MSRPLDGSDKHSVELRNKRLVARAKDRDNAFAALLGTREGRAWVWDFLANCGVFSTTHVPGQPDASAFREGARSVGLQVTADVMRLAPRSWEQMAREAEDAARAPKKSETDGETE